MNRTRDRGHAGVSASQADKRREFSKRQNIRRQVFRDMTTFQIFPLQAMAMDDFDKRLKDYFNNGVDQTDDISSDESESSRQRPRQKQSVVTVDNDSASVSSSDSDYLRQQFKREFEREKSIGISAVIVMKDSTVRKAERAKGGLDDDLSRTNDGGDIISSDQNCTTLSFDLQQSNVTQDDFHTVDFIKNSNHPKVECISSNLEDGNVQTREVKEEFLSTLWSMEPRIFAMETSMKGKRRYISAHLGRFMDQYWRECDVYSRHYYELIREKTPCRLYFG